MSRIFSQHWKDYELLDAGGSKKLERWGNITTIRPERNAYFRSVQKHEEWRKQADFEFVEVTHNKGQWKQLNPEAENTWEVAYRNIKMQMRLTKFKHLGLFPEQQENWDFIEKNIGKDERFLNLFGYTGAASLVARSNGADVFHCDSVKQVIQWSRENMELSGLSDIHWVLDDALKFASREAKRGKKYKGIVMDPPAFGIGAKKERWKIEDKFEELMDTALNLRQADGFIIINTYSPRLEEKDISEIGRSLIRAENFQVDTLCLKTTTEKIIENGQRTLITP